MEKASRRHDAILRTVIEQCNGRVFKTIGDAFCSAFARPQDALDAMLAAQRALGAEDFSGVDGLRVRAAINSGTADERDGDFFGPALNKVARLLAIGHGAQVLLTAESAALVADTLETDTTLRDLGAYHLKDFAEPQRVYQVIAAGLPAEFPPLRSLGTLPSDLSIFDTTQFRSVPTFSGRDTEFAAVDDALQHDTGIVVVHGLGGVGKSSIAREYGWRNRNKYSVTWWLNAQTEDGIVDGLLRLGGMFAQGLGQLADRRGAAQRVIDSLLAGFDKAVLLVFDNLEEELLMRTWLPRTACALATSRDAAWSADITAIPLQTWSTETAIEYLLSASGRPDMSAAEARDLVDALAALPLALAHAAAALRGMRMITPRRYLERINEHLKNAPYNAEYPHSVFATFNTAIAQAEQQAPGAAAVLSFAASFAPDAIPDEILRAPANLAPNGLQPAVPGGGALDLRSALAGDLQLDVALAALDRLALLTFDQSSHTYAMHRLVQLAGRGLVDDASGWSEFALTRAYAAFPRPNFSTWPQCERIIPHARAALNAMASGAAPPAAAELAQRCASYLHARGEYAAAEQLGRRALEIREGQPEPDLDAIASALNNLAVLYMDLGRNAEAEPLYRRALEIREARNGIDHPTVAGTLGNLAIACMELGRLEEAEQLNLRALAIRERAFTPDHLEVAWSLTGLGVLRRYQCRYAEAESLLRRVAATREAALGSDHPDVAYILMQLAEVYADAGRAADAEPLYVRALAIWEKALELFGPDHPDVAEGLRGLARVYRDQGRAAEARPLLARSLEIFERRLGTNHPATVRTREAFEGLRSSG
jgi:tetratricopeptide (TPR) repeat protein